MNCPNCFLPIQPDDTVCSHCGTSLAPAGSPAPGGMTPQAAPTGAGATPPISPSPPPVTPTPMADGSSSASSTGAQDQDDSDNGSSIPGAGIAKGFLDRRRQRKEEEAQAAARAAAEKAARRQALFEQTRATCPLPLTLEESDLPGGLQLFEDEFVVGIARDWGLTTKKLILTTNRVIHAKGILTKDQEVINLTDVADVNYHKTLLLHGELSIETNGGHSLTGLPHVKNGNEVRNQLLSLVNWAKHRPLATYVVDQPRAPVAAAPIASAPSDRYEQLKKLADLHTSGVLSDDEFSREKAKILAGS